MTRVVISAAAQDDLDDIWLHVANDSPVAADQFIDRIVDTVGETLATAPFAGRAREELGAGLRSLPVENYLIFYQVNESTIEIVRMLHGARDFDSTFDA